MVYLHSNISDQVVGVEHNQVSSPVKREGVQDLPWLRRNVDLVLGLLAWLVALSNFIPLWSININLALVYAALIAPIVWVIIIIKAIKKRRRKLVYLLWIFLSVPAILMGWFFVVISIIAVSRFAP